LNRKNGQKENGSYKHRFIIVRRVEARENRLLQRFYVALRRKMELCEEKKELFLFRAIVSFPRRW
jgi:hypothetical protein